MICANGRVDLGLRLTTAVDCLALASESVFDQLRAHPARIEIEQVIRDKVRRLYA